MADYDSYATRKVLVNPPNGNLVSALLVAAGTVNNRCSSRRCRMDLTRCDHVYDEVSAAPLGQLWFTGGLANRSTAKTSVIGLAWCTILTEKHVRLVAGRVRTSHRQAGTNGDVYTVLPFQREDWRTAPHIELVYPGAGGSVVDAVRRCMAAMRNEAEATFLQALAIYPHDVERWAVLRDLATDNGNALVRLLAQQALDALGEVLDKKPTTFTM